MHASAVQRGVQRAEGGLGVCHGGFHLRLVAHIRGQGDGPPACGRDGLHGGVEPGCGHVHAADRGTECCKTLRDARADPAACTGYERNLPVQPE